MSRDEDALLDIRERIDFIAEHGPRDEATLERDVVVQAATLYWLEITGEAADRVSSASNVISVGAYAAISGLLRCRARALARVKDCERLKRVVPTVKSPEL